MSIAFEPARVGRYTTRNRVVMAPMTRNRASGPGNSPTDLMAAYYGQRASAGLIVTEGTQPSAQGQGYVDTPGLHSAAQVEGWRRVTDAVHERSGLIFAQLMHTGRIGHPTINGMVPVGASPVRATGQVHTPQGKQDLVEPLPLDAAGIRSTVDDFARAAERAVEAGFDGVEIHGANGYLLHQFLSTNANLREDEWGGDAAGRARLTLETARAVSDTIGADRTALRLSPGSPLGDLVEDDAAATYSTLVTGLDPLGLAYLHLVEPEDAELLRAVRDAWTGTLILNPSTPGRWTGPQDLERLEGDADLIAFGSLFIANPDLPERLRSGASLAAPDYAYAYVGGERGYVDYPALGQSEHAVQDASGPVAVTSGN